ncbi:MAG: hypothetical protein ACKON9_22695 [Planctomycetaceae bacterium]
MNTIQPIAQSLLLLSLILPGCSGEGNARPGSIGQTIGQNVTEFAQGVGTGVDKQLQVDIELSPDLTKAGLSHTIAKQKTSIDDPQKAISIYLLSANAIKCTLIAKAYNADDQEIGRATSEVEFAEDDAQYIAFTFPAEMDRQTVKVYKIAEKPSGAEQKVQK